MKRYALQRDSAEPAIVEALERVGCNVYRGVECDLYVHRPATGVRKLLEVKTPGSNASRRQPIQKWFEAEFSPIYSVVTDVSSALKAMGIE